MADTETIQDTIEGMPSVVLQNNIWGWHKLSYPILRRALLRLVYEGAAEGSEWDQTTFDDMQSNIDEWILSNDKSLQDADPAKWKNGLVSLDDAEVVFPNYLLTKTTRIIMRPGCLPGYEILCEGRAPHIFIQPSTAAFRRNFDYMSDGLLRNLNWNNLIVAGGIVLGTLLYNSPEDWKSSDIDIYVYGLSGQDANKKIQHVFDTFRSNLPTGTRTLAVRNSKTITFYAKYPLRRLQIVLKLLESPRDVLLNFDLDICAIGWDGSNVWMLPRAARALETGCNVFTMNLIYGHYLSERRASQTQRVFKYANRGYGLRILPAYISSLDRSVPEMTGNSRDGAPSLPLNLELLANETRVWAEQWITETLHQSRRSMASPRELPGNCLAGFSTFMRCVALWEKMKNGDMRVFDDWGPGDSSYEDRASRSPHPEYPWDAAFTFTGFRSHIEQTNLNEVGQWIKADINQRLERHGVSHGYNLSDSVRRMSGAPTLELLLQRELDVCLPVLLPCNFAVYANDLVSRAQDSLGLKERKILEPAMPGYSFRNVPGDEREGLFIWRVSSDLMWQKLDRRIDEIFEVLYSFRRVNVDLNDDLQAQRLTRELSRRDAKRDGNEFDAFARWVGRRPLEVRRAASEDL
ncbi:hypothetical protein FB451DRAFT_1128513 [Mycena latifolia]|nr:hypothetical protein FB451DRAFT_1128513 [Mycena latifolia]